MKKSMSTLLWGIFLLLAASFVVFNSIDGGFVDIGFGSILIAFLAFSFLLLNVTRLNFAPVPFSLAVLYIVFQSPLRWPEISTWMLLLAALFASMGLYILLPKGGKGYFWNRVYGQDGMCAAKNGSDDSDTPIVNANLSGISRYIHSDNLKTVRLNCNLGALEIYFGGATLSPDGAEVICDCKMGAIEMYVPKHWRVADNVACTMGAVEIGKRYGDPPEDAPLLKLSGTVVMGALEVKFV